MNFHHVLQGLPSGGIYRRAGWLTGTFICFTKVPEMHVNITKRSAVPYTREIIPTMAASVGYVVSPPRDTILLCEDPRAVREWRATPEDLLANDWNEA